MLTKNQSQWLWEDYLREKGKAWLKVSSGSMAPLIPIGTEILVKRCYSRDLRLFDLVVFRSKEHLVVHRVLKKGKYQLLQGGDSFSVPSLISRESVLGRVELIKGTNYVINLKKKKNIFLNMVISVFYILARKIPHHNYRLLRINKKLINSIMRKPNFDQT
jgi:hypothetical protein